MSIKEFLVSERISLSLYLVNSYETRLKYVVKSANLVKENIENKEEWREVKLKEKWKASETMSYFMDDFRGTPRQLIHKIRCFGWREANEAPNRKPTGSRLKPSPEY